MTKKNRSFIILVSLSVAVTLFCACSKEGASVPSVATTDYRQVAVEFTNALAARQYDNAYAMTSQGYRRRSTVDQLRAAFEAIVPADWGAMGPIEAGQALTNWSGKQPSDLGWVYVSIGGDVYSEAVIVVVMSENGEAKIREVEFGRP